MLDIYSELHTKDYSSALISAVLSELAMSIEHMRVQTDWFRDLIDDKAKWS
jgi:hypothetical protein